MLRDYVPKIIPIAAAKSAKNETTENKNSRSSRLMKPNRGFESRGPFVQEVRSALSSASLICMARCCSEMPPSRLVIVRQ
jgi:hypothetical protein